MEDEKTGSKEKLPFLIEICEFSTIRTYVQYKMRVQTPDLMKEMYVLHIEKDLSTGILFHTEVIKMRTSNWVLVF